jgi:hypothetical protein
MKILTQHTRFAGYLTIAMTLACLSSLSAAEPQATQRLFASPDDAVQALRAATEARNKAALLEIFGAQYQELATGDAVQDANNVQRFAREMSQGCNPVKEGEDKITFEIGTNEWPFPIPLVKADGQWHFDTAAGKEEIINRHIGKDELHAIGVCRAYVLAQKQYADMNPKVGGGANYAQKFKSSPGKKDGLYWPQSENESASPFGPLVAEAHAEGYGNNKSSGPHAFHGYYFRLRACLKTTRGCCGEGFWLWPRRRGRSIPAAGCSDRANGGHGQKTRRPEGFQQKAVWLCCSSVEDPSGVFSFVAPRHLAFCWKTASPGSFQTGSYNRIIATGVCVPMWFPRC